MDFLAAIRNLFAIVDVFIADLISKVYLIILQIADANIVTDEIREFGERVYGIIGLFMLFKLALAIINYIVNPEKTQPVGKLLTRIVVALVLIPTMPVIFEKSYQLQGIILKENIIGDIILGDGKNLDEEGEELEKIGDQVAYLVFSNFLSYNSDGPLVKVFKDCKNIFLEPDELQEMESFQYCSYVPIPVPVCGYYLYYPSTIDPEYGVLEDGTYSDKSRTKYYNCKQGDDTDVTRAAEHTMLCGIRDGQYIYDLINEGRENYSVKTILSSEIITATENDPFFSTSTICNRKHEEIKSKGDFVFDYKFLSATLVGIIVLFLLIIICVDVGIRAAKLAFLEVISPIPIISYVDIKESKLFSEWLKETITTYLQLFIRLAVIFFSILLFKAVFDGMAENEFFVNIFMIIGIILFTLQMPKLLCDLFNLKTENGFFSIIKNTLKFTVGATAIGVSAIGGVASNVVHTKDRFNYAKDSASAANANRKNFKNNFKNADGFFGKAGVVGSTLKSFGSVPLNFLRVPGGIIGGGLGAAGRTAKSLMNNKGGYKSGTVTSSIKEDVMKREAKYSGISKLSQDDIKFEISQLEKDQENLQTRIDSARENIAVKLAGESNSDDIVNAFSGDKHESYADYVASMTASGQGSHIIDENKYNEYSKLYDESDSIEQEYEDVKERLKLLNRYVKEK